MLPVEVEEVAKKERGVGLYEGVKGEVN